ncbi:MAG: Rieske (2Fe-2S) protein [Nitrososphaerales archaeon]
MVWTKLGPKDGVEVGSGKEFTANGVQVAVFNVSGRFYATEALCRHQAGPLADGKLKGEIVECPWHFWHYNVRTGRLTDYIKNIKLDTYSVKVQGSDLYIDL